MKVFISWSGQLSKAIAGVLHSWLPQVIQSLSPWMSAVDISAGTRWSPAIADELATAQFGIICVTPENVGAPWLLFEAGALSNALTDPFVCPYVFALAPADLTGPLAQFQAVSADRDGTRRLLRDLNTAGEKEQLPESQLDQTFRVWWPRLQKSLSAITASANSSAETTDDRAALREILERVRNLDPKPSELYVLVSFAPSTGVGIYEFKGAKQRFTASTEEISIRKNSSLDGQVPAGYYFSSLKELFAFCRREYLAMRKGAYYSSLFTKGLSQKQSSRTLQFLNQPNLANVRISPVVVSVIKEAVEVKRVCEIVLRAHELKLNNVKACLAVDLAEIVLSKPIVEFLRTTKEGTAAMASIMESRVDSDTRGSKS